MRSRHLASRQSARATPEIDVIELAALNRVRQASETRRLGTFIQNAALARNGLAAT